MDARVEGVLESFTKAAAAAFGERLRSLILFGSAAEDRLRPVSDVNVLVVLRSFDPAARAALGDEIRRARAAIDLRPVFLLESELPAARELFAVKFDDVARRHRVLHGADPFPGDQPPRAARINSLRQTLLNLTIRLRERYLSLLDEDQADVLASFAGPVRAAAAEWLALRDNAVVPPRDALLRAARELGDAQDAAAIDAITAVREGRAPAPEVARETVLRIARITARLLTAAEALKP